MSRGVCPRIEILSSAALPQSLLIVDAAYGDFAHADLTGVALTLPNAVVVRSLSKSWGLAGLRVGYAIGPRQVIDWMKAAGHPYAVSGPSLALAAAWLKQGGPSARRFIDSVRHEREALFQLLRGPGAKPTASQANFVLARFGDATFVRDALGSLGIAVRSFPGNPLLDNCLRITCPGCERQFTRLSAAIQTILRPEAMLFDLDGVIADESESYRCTISVADKRSGSGR